MKKIKIYAGISGVIPNGSYQNLKPSLLREEEIPDCHMTDEEIEGRQKELYAKCYRQFADIEVQAVVDRIKKERQDFRFVKSPSGKMLPSVTSIINYDADFFVSDDELKQYASQGNVIDARVKHYIKTGEWIDPAKLQDIWTDLVILRKGSLKLGVDVGDFPSFLKKYPIDGMAVCVRFFNEEHEYTGEGDFVGIPRIKDVKEIPTVFDVKRTPDTHKNGMQLAAYCKGYGIEQGIIVPLNGKTQQGYSKPVIYNKEKLEGYFKMFLRKRKDFFKRYSI